MLHFLIYDVLGTPAILVGLFSLIGLLLQKKGISDVISGTLKTIMGFVILTAGAGIIAYTLTIFSQLFEHSFHIQGVVPNTDAMAALAQKNYGTETATIMVLGMLINIALARLTPLKYIFLTGHHTLYMAAMLAVILSVGGLSGGWVVAIGAVILGAMMVISPAILQPFTRKITNTDDLALGHFGSIGYLLSALVGKIIGKGSPSIEEIKVPKSLNFLRDSSVAISLTMMILFLVLVLVAGKSFVEETLSAGQNFIIFAIIQSLTFAAGVYIILAGVRMVIAEIVPAFKGIADKLGKRREAGAGLSDGVSLRSECRHRRLPRKLCRRAGQYVPLPAVRLERHRPGPGSPLFLRGHSGGLRQHYRRTSRGGGRGFCSRSAHFVPACHSLAHDGGYGTGLHNLWRRRLWRCRHRAGSYHRNV
ncbi:Putative integral membrane protein [Klebsiella pneumoniae ISC21]|nr:Putative integral membrane protein [Klebsiella pneumoniae ISC21]